MTKSEQLLAFVDKIVKERLDYLTYLSKTERLGFSIGIYSIFEKSPTVEDAYYELLDYLEEHEELASLTTKIEMFYTISFNN